MDLRDFYNRFSLDENLAKVTGFNPYYQRIDSGLNRKIRVNGHEMIDLASNNYLGLATDVRVKQAAVEAIQKYGVSLCGTPIAQATLICTKGWKKSYQALSVWRRPSSSLRVTRLIMAYLVPLPALRI